MQRRRGEFIEVPTVMRLDLINEAPWNFCVVLEVVSLCGRTQLLNSGWLLLLSGSREERGTQTRRTRMCTRSHPLDCCGKPKKEEINSPAARNNLKHSLSRYSLLTYGQSKSN